MQDLKNVIARNIADLRRGAHLTQIELAERLNYSDKAVSKWERGESIPDVMVLKEIADLFGVSVDYLLQEEHHEAVTAAPPHRSSRLVITLLSVSLVWLIATALFVLGRILLPAVSNLYLLFVYAVPVTAIVTLVFNSIWGKAGRNYPIVSVLVWSALAAIYLSIPGERMWMIFLLGIPAQLIILLWSRLAPR